MKNLSSICGAGWLAVSLCVSSCLQAADAPDGTLPASCAPLLDAAARSLANGDLVAARSGFNSVLDDVAAPPFVRGLAFTGLAETALASNDRTTALDWWKRQMADPTLTAFQRELAGQRLVGSDREVTGIPVRSPAEFRASLPSLPLPALTFFVAPDGAETNDGSRTHPFATLAQARDAIRRLKQAGGGDLPVGGVQVILVAGDYPVRETFTLGAEDSGSAVAPVVYRAAPGATVRLQGGCRITNWKPIRDSVVKARLSPGVADAVLEADLKPLGRQDWGDPTALRERPELFVDGVPQTLARWPNEGFVKTGEIRGTNTFKVWNSIPGCRDGRFEFVEDRPLNWLDEPDVRLYGYWFWDWFEEYQKVAAIDADPRTFTLAPPFSNYGYRKDQRYHAVNVFRELDQPGEWYLDRQAERLYWLPRAEVRPDQAEIVVSMVAAPFIRLEDVRHVILLGLTLEAGRGDGIHVSGGEECLVAGCTVRRMGGDGVVVQGGRRHGVFGCLIETMGCGGTRVAGGHRETLEPGGHFVENCVVRDISRLKRTYTPAVHLDGCGNRIAHNRFEDMPSSAMRIEGNDHLIELNVVRDVVKESDDQGGVDMFGNPLYRGVVIRWNRWSDIGGGTHNGAAGVRLDDMISGVTVHGNVFERCGAVIFGGVQIHGGKDNLIDNNLFLDCFAGVSFSRWGEKRWLEAIDRFRPQATGEVYRSHYLELANLTTGADVNDLCRNVFVRCGRTYLRDGGVPRTTLSTLVAGDFEVSRVTDPVALRSDPALRSTLFEPIPLNEIGPYPHPWFAGDGDILR
ncbi:MAG: right-handed parallel beta-helix repeat-containing protein [Verrucomicrobiales bacterium]|nr:right-handed parallel beta-helix repeat-containing protein [Verrucomicrobiales bacterium]